MTKCEYCGITWGNHETSPGSGVMVGGVHWCQPMLAHMRIKEEVERQLREEDPIWQEEQRVKWAEHEESRRQLMEAFSKLPGVQTYEIDEEAFNDQHHIVD